MKRPAFSMVFYLVLVFLSGVLVGSVGADLYHARSVSAKSANPTSPEELRRRYAEELRTRLKLRSEQTQKLAVILEGTHQRFRQLRQKYQPEVRVIQDAQAEQIRAILDASQQGEYERMRREWEQERELRHR